MGSRRTYWIEDGLTAGVHYLNPTATGSKDNDSIATFIRLNQRRRN